MAVLSDDIIAGAQELANLVGADWISPATWLRWLNQSIVALFQKIVVWNPDFFLSHVDFSSDGTANNPFAPPADFGVARGITKDPSVLRQRRSLRSYNFADRDRQRELAYRVDGGLIYLESATAFNVNLRLWYDAKPITLVQAPTPDVIVRAASAADLSVANPSQLWLPDQANINIMSLSGGGGTGGALLVDGVNIGLNGLSGDTILIRHGAAATTPSIFVRVLSTSPLPGTVVYSPDDGVPGGTSLSRSSGDPGYVDLVVDGVTPTAGVPGVGDQILVNGEANPIHNGLYRCVENDPGGWRLQRMSAVEFNGGNTGHEATPLYNADFTIAAARVGVTDGSVNGGTTWRLTSGVAVDSAALTWIEGIVPGKGLWLCGGTGESGRLFFSRMSQALDAAVIPKGLLVESTEGVVNADALFASTGDFDTIGSWKVGTSDVSFDLFTDTNVLPSLYEPFVEWLEVRTAIRGLGKEENDAAKELKDRLGDTPNPSGLTLQAMDYVDALNSGDGIAVADVEHDGELPWGWPWNR